MLYGENMKRLLYVSDSTIADEISKLDDIMLESVIWNHDNKLTGILWSTEKKFAQVIEGNETSIDELLNKLHKDPRHTNIQVVDYSVIEKREFGNWSMRYPENDPMFEIYETLMRKKLRKIDNDLARKFEEIIQQFK